MGANNIKRIILKQRDTIEQIAVLQQMSNSCSFHLFLIEIAIVMEKIQVIE